MAVREIRIYGDPVLREQATSIEQVDPEVRRLAEDMLDTVEDADGIGLAGPQVGVLQRIIVARPPAEKGGTREPGRVLVNPVILEKRGPVTSAEEGCLSIPDVYEMVKRPEQIRVRAVDLDGEEFELEAEGILSRIIQHEIDHLDGVLFIDRIGPMRRALLKKKLRSFLE